MTKKAKKNLVALFACAAVLSVGSAVAANNFVTANAAVDWTTDNVISESEGFYTQDGASIKIVGNSSDYAIRWTANVTEAFDAELKEQFEGATIKYGSLIAPASFGELTVDTADVSNAYWTVQPSFSAGATYEYTAGMRYDKLTEAQKTEAFALELQARMYVEIVQEGQEPVYYYAEQNDVNRSMRGVAISAIHYADEPDIATGVAQYVGGGFASTTANTQINGFVECETSVEGTVTAEKLTAGTEYEVYVGGVKLPANVTADSEGKATVDVTKLPAEINQKAVTAGEEYDMLLIDENRNVVVQPFRAVSKVLRNTNDFATTFKMTTATLNTSGQITAADTFDGYYVLGESFTWDNTYTHNVDGTSDAVLKTVKMRQTHACADVGLTGTFDGNGHTITGMQVTSGGLFGFVSGGTVKNVAFEDVKTSYLAYSSTAEHLSNSQSTLSFSLKNAKVENVYIHAATMNAINAATLTGNRGLVTNAILGTTVIKDSIFKLDEMTAITGTNGMAGWNGSLCSIDYRSSTSATGHGSQNTALDSAKHYDRSDWENVYIISPMVEFSYQAWNKTDAEKASVSITGYDAATSSYVKLDAVKRYDTAADMVAANNDYSGFDSNYWTTKEGFIPVFKGGSFVKYVAEELTYEQDTQTLDLTALGLSDGEDITSVAFADGSHTASYTDGKLVVDDFTADGNVYGLEFTTSEATYHANVKMVSKVLRNTNDFATTFKMTTATVNTDGQITAVDTFDGYYVLGESFTWDNTYTHNVDGTSDAVLKTVKMRQTHACADVGLTGTFDGNGHTITGMQVTSGGLFGFVSGGTVKNVAFEDVKTSHLAYSSTAEHLSNSQSTLSFSLKNAKVENVYIHAATMNAINAATLTGNRGLVTNAILGTTVIKDSIFKLDEMTAITGKNGTAGWNGSLCSIDYRSSTSTTGHGSQNTAIDSARYYDRSDWENVYIISPMVEFSYQAWNKTDAEKASVSITGYDAATSSYVKLDAVKRYDTAADMVAANNDYSGFDSNYWTTGEDGTPVFKAKTANEEASSFTQP